MSLRGAGLATLTALLLAPAASAGAGADAGRAILAVDRLESFGGIDAAEAERLRIVVKRARAELKLLPGRRGEELAAVLRQVGRNGAAASPARLRALVATLDENASYLGVNDVPVPKAYARDADGVVYRAFPGVGLQFHPLQTFARLNALVSGRDRFGAIRLATRLLQLGERRGDTLVWSYEFDFSGGSPPWTSGMAQAVAAQSLARTAAAFGAEALFEPARRAYDAVPADLTRAVSAGPWVRLYSFNDLVVLNAQLQTALSLEDYGSLSGDARAADLSAALRRSAAALLPSFDTGYWSRYTLAGESSLGYHVYVVSLLEKLARRTALPFWRRAAARFARYTEEPPGLESRGVIEPLYPTPADGWRDSAVVRFWVSKRSDVTVQVGGVRRSLSLGQGLHAVPWTPPAGRTGRFRARVSAVDLAGNRSVLRLPPVLVRVDRKAPRVEAELDGLRLRWKAIDAGTPNVRLELRLKDGERVKTRNLGVREHEGSVRVSPAGRRSKAVLHVVDVSGNRARVRLGELRGPPGRPGAVPTIA